MLLADHPAQEAPRILQSLATRGVRATKQGVYKELRALIRDSVVIKHGRAFSLSIPWILSFSQLADRIFDTYVGQSNLRMFIPEGKNSAHWSFRNLALLNDFWVELIFTLLKENPREPLYNWLPHPWFVLLQSVRTKTWSIAMRDTGWSIKTILGHDSPLDLAYRQRQNDQLPTETISFATSPFHGNEHQYLEVIGDWLITVSLDAGITELIEKFFSNPAQSLEGAALNEAAAQLRADRRVCRLRVERNTTQSRKIRKQFLEYWGK